MCHTDILNEMDEVIYVVDLERHELLFLNETAHKVCTEGGNPIDGKCYEVLQGRSAPCNFCPIEFASREHFHSWEYTNLKFNRHFLVRDKVVPWEGGEARLFVAIDITRQEREKNALQKKLSIESTVVECIRILQQSPELDDALEKLMQVLAQFYKADRVHMMAFDDDEGTSITIHEWCAPGVESCKCEMLALVREHEDAWRGEFSSVGHIMAQAFPERKHGKSFSDIVLATLDANAVMSVPFLHYARDDASTGKVEDSWHFSGSLGVDNPRHAFGDTSLLESVAYFVKNDVEKRSIKDYLVKLSYQDSLTKLGNRNRYIQKLDELRKLEVSSIGVAFIDINGLKAINDSFGHDYGDHIIIHVAEIVKSVFKDDVFRTGGDEFIVLCANHEQDVFLAQIERMKSIFAEVRDCEVSCGVAWKDSISDIEGLVRYADELMYVEKQNYYQEGRGLRSLHHSSILEETLLSLQHEEFMVYLQPKVRLSDNRVAGAEALIRKRDMETGELIPPDKFIPLLESEFIIRHIDFFVLHKVCEMLQRWMNTGVDIFPISINLSRITLMEHGIVNKVAEVCGQYGVPNKYIDIEITESVGKMSLESLSEISEAFISGGFTVSLDDFGSKYCNMSLLTKLRFNTVKIDKSIVDDMCRDERASIITRHSLGLFADLEGVHAVAEGIEDEDQLAMLKGMNCMYGQGYLFSKPLPIDEFEICFVSLLGAKTPKLGKVAKKSKIRALPLD